MAQTAAVDRAHRVAAGQGGNVFAFAWRQSRQHQPWLCLLAVLIFPLTMVPLELQRRIIDRGIGEQNLDLVLWLGAIYLAVILIQGALKYLLRLYRGMVSERDVLDLRRTVQAKSGRGDEGETVSIVATEVERVGGLVGEAFSEPILQGGVLVAVLGYMLVVEPTIALVSFALRPFSDAMSMPPDRSSLLSLGAGMQLSKLCRVMPTCWPKENSLLRRSSKLVAPRHSSCFANRAEISPHALSTVVQRTAMNAIMEGVLVGNSRKTILALPVSMYFSLSCGSTVLWKAAQAGQVRSAYSTMVMGASALPTTISGWGPGLASSLASWSAASLGRLLGRVSGPSAAVTRREPDE